MVTPGSFVRLGRRYLHKPPPSLALARTLVRGRRGIEVGGPSQVFEEWYSFSPHGVTYPLYGQLEQLDNCDFQQSTTWAEHEQAYRF